MTFRQKSVQNKFEDLNVYIKKNLKEIWSLLLKEVKANNEGGKNS